MNTSELLEDCRAARVPREGLAALAPLRRLTHIRIVEASDAAWIVWEGPTPSIVRALQPVPGIAFYTHRDGHCLRFGASLPDFGVTLNGAELRVDRAVLPAPLAPLPPPDVSGGALRVTLVPCQRPRPASAMRLDLDRLRHWSERATTLEIHRLRGAVCGSLVWLLGEKLPVLPGAERFWGGRVLAPLGMRPDPDWPEKPLRAAAVVDDDEILVLTREGSEAFPRSAFRSLTRASVRRHMR